MALPSATGVKDCLVVDDEPRLRAVLVRLLAAEGFTCREAASGAEALTEMEREPAALVISDVRMPVMDGITLLREIVRRWPGTAFIIVTAVAEAESAVSALQLGAMDYIAKPFQLEEVRARVYQALDKRRLILENRDYQRDLEERVRVQARRIGELFLEGVQALAVALEAKDAYLRGHSTRVAAYAVGTAHRLGLTAEEVETLALGANLHDIGKIGVREEVLHKPDRLTDDEYRHIMEHPLIGARILSPLLKDQPVALAIVRSHHERLDGSGLPDGLRGDAIPVAVRIASVADAFDAMTSARPYRSGLAIERALNELRTGRGVQFDPEIVDAFFAEFPADRLPIATPTTLQLPGSHREFVTD
jgi:response regulator RpfG family c-di-GMP phosphodiesterase